MKFGGLCAPVSFILRNFSSRLSIPVLRITTFFLNPWTFLFHEFVSLRILFFPRPRATETKLRKSCSIACKLFSEGGCCGPKVRRPDLAQVEKTGFFLSSSFFTASSLFAPSSTRERARISLSFSIYLSFYMAFFLPLFCRLVSVFLVFARGARDVTAWANTREPCMILRDQIHLACPPHRFPLPITYS